MRAGVAAKKAAVAAEAYETWTPEQRAEWDLIVDPNATPLMTFTEYVNKVKPEYVWYRYAQEIADALQLVADGVIKRLLIFAPPQIGKSELVSRIFPAYLLYRFPQREYGLGSYGALLAHKFSREARRNYKLGLDSQSTGGETEGVEQWETGKGGGLWVAGVGGSATGRVAYGVIIDDPVKGAQDAASEVIQERNIEWFDQVIVPRTVPHNGFIVLVQTRWHQQDLAGKLLEREEGDAPEGWTVINLAAIYDPDAADTFPPTCDVWEDWRKPGESVCPERLSLPVLHAIKRGSAYRWNALYQQNPTPHEGGMFQRTWFGIADREPPASEIIVTVRRWDIAATEGAGDYTVGVKMCRTRSGDYYVLDVVRDQWEGGRRDARIRQTAQMDGYGVRVLGPQDPGAAGKDQARAFTRLLDGFIVATERESGDKETRADPLAAAAYTDNPKGGTVKLVRAPWNEAFLAELAAFPYGAHDDQVDAAAAAYNYLARWRATVIKAAPTKSVWTG